MPIRNPKDQGSSGGEESEVESVLSLKRKSSNIATHLSKSNRQAIDHTKDQSSPVLPSAEEEPAKQKYAETQLAENSPSHYRLKSITAFPSLDPTLTSDRLVDFVLPLTVASEARAVFRAAREAFPPPLLSASPFLPPGLAQHLMRNKKSSAIGCKFVERNGNDSITNAEGALHSLLTPIIVRCAIVGDYEYKYGHRVRRFPKGKVRECVLSAAIQMDFEDTTVMMALARLEPNEVKGKNLLTDPNWRILSVEDKQNQSKREEYDAEIKAHIVFCLVGSHRLPAKTAVAKTNILDDKETVAFLENILLSFSDGLVRVVNKFIEVGGVLLSLELLYNTAVQQARNEISALETICTQGYIYTYDPASIFAQELGAPILNRLMLCAIQTLSRHNTFSNMKIFAFNTYAEPTIMPLVVASLRGQKTIVVRKEDLFRGKEGGLYNIDQFEGCERAMLVLHNNSDGFGQNIETEHSRGSLDGAIGANSSGAASLERGRADLMDFLC